MSAPKKAIPGFKIDPVTGKYVPVPVDFKALFPNLRREQSNQGAKNFRKSDDTHSMQPVKFRKTETGVRKVLFKPTITHHAEQKDLPTNDMKSKQPGVIKCLPTKNDSKRPAPKIPMIPTPEEYEQVEEPTREDEVKTPIDFDSTANFLKLEQLCQTPTITNESQNMILNSEKNNNNNQPLSQKEVILEIRQTIKEGLELQTRQQENLRKMMLLVDKLENNSKECSAKRESDEEKENSAKKGRFLRPPNKSATNNLGRAAGSSAILKSGDLRKFTLTKSLAAKCKKY